MERQTSGRTPNSILKRQMMARAHHDENKRSRMSIRRVSFAPDDELETMHLFTKENRRDLDDTDKIVIGTISPVQQEMCAKGPWDYKIYSQSSPTAQTANQDSPSLSPLSMDLTNNTMNPQQFVNQYLYRNMNEDVPTELPENITNGVPALSTLLEEDEEFAFDSSRPDMHESEISMDLSDGYSGPPANFRNSSSFSSPIQQTPDPSPLCPGSLRDKWGFVPGEDDTMQVPLMQNGLQMMGDETYKHIYGDGSTGTLTMAIKGGMSPKQQLSIFLRGGARVQNVTSISPSLEPVSANKVLDKAALGSVLQSSPAASEGEDAALLADANFQDGMTTKLLADDGLTDIWGRPTIGKTQQQPMTGLGSVASNRMTAYLHRLQGETTNLLDSQVAGITTQLLRDTETQGAMEQFMKKMQAKPFVKSLFNDDVPLPDVTAASSNGGGKTLTGMVAYMETNFQAGGTLEEQTLDDFDLPPAPIISPSTPTVTAALAQQVLSTSQPALEDFEEPVTFQAPLTLQAFLTLVDVHFPDSTRISSISTLSELDVQVMPKTLEEACSLAFETLPQAPLYQESISTVQRDLLSAQALLEEAESRLSEKNPSIYASVQAANPVQRSLLKEQLALFKRCCRLQTMTKWKERRIRLEVDLASVLATQGEAATKLKLTLQGCLQRLKQLEQQMEATHFKLCERMEAEVLEHETFQERAVAHEAQLRLLEGFRESNAARHADVEHLESQMESSRRKFEEIMQRNSEARRELQELTNSLGEQTPGRFDKSSSQHAQRSEEMMLACSLSRCVVGASEDENDPRWSITYREAFTLRMEPGESTTVSISQRQPNIFNSSDASALLPLVKGITESTTLVPKSQVRPHIQRTLQQLSPIIDVAHQLRELSQMCVNLTSVASDDKNLILTFIELKTYTKVVFRVAMQDLASLHVQVPQYTATVERINGDDAGCLQLLLEVLQGASSGCDYLSDMCCKISSYLRG